MRRFDDWNISLMNSAVQLCEQLKHYQKFLIYIIKERVRCSGLNLKAFIKDQPPQILFTSRDLLL